MEQVDSQRCRVGVAYGEPSELYSFPLGHPLNNSRVALFARSLKSLEQEGQVVVYDPVPASERELLEFHDRTYIEFVKKSSLKGEGFLDYGDTPSFKGVYEASLYTVGSTLIGLEEILSGRAVEHFFNPVGGLHHARRDSAGGFCVFDDPAVAIAKALGAHELRRAVQVDIQACDGDSRTRDKQARELGDSSPNPRVAYVDIDAHHGDGVYYGFEDDPRVIIADIHEDGRFLYPGTGFASETGKRSAAGTKLNIPLPPSSGDEAFLEAFDKVLEFLSKFEKELSFVFLQCGADGLAGDPLTHLRYSEKAHAYAARKLHELAHRACEGRILAMGGGGYNPHNVDKAWSAVIKELSVL